MCIFSKLLTLHKGTGSIDENCGFFDYLFYVTAGMPKFNPDKNNLFQVPALWLAINLIPAFLVQSYTVKDLEGVGLQMLLRNKSRSIWWFSKCFWNISTVVLSYLIVWLTFIVGTLLLGNTDEIWKVHEPVWHFIVGEQTQEAASKSMMSIQFNGIFLALMVFVPLFVSVGMSLMQMALSLMIGPIGGFICILSVYVLSAYFTSPLLIGNYTMIIRSGYMPINGINMVNGIFAGILVGVIGIIIGWFYLKNADIL